MTTGISACLSQSKPLRPRRVQLSRKRGWRKQANTVVVARPSKWGNPFRVARYTLAEYASGAAMADAMAGVCITREAAVNRYRDWLRSTPEGRFTCRAAKKVLRGQNLACWCPLGEPCHADVLLEIANR